MVVQLHLVIQLVQVVQELFLRLMYELKRRGGGLGIAAICSGGGQGDAILIEVPKQDK